MRHIVAIELARRRARTNTGIRAVGDDDREVGFDKSTASRWYNGGVRTATSKHQLHNSSHRKRQHWFHAWQGHSQRQRAIV